MTRSIASRTREPRSTGTTRHPNPAVPGVPEPLTARRGRPSDSELACDDEGREHEDPCRRAMALPLSARPSAPRAWGIVPRGRGRSEGTRRDRNRELGRR